MPGGKARVEREKSICIYHQTDYEDLPGELWAPVKDLFGETASWIDPGVPTKYLGAGMDPWVRSVRTPGPQVLTGIIAKIGKAALKGRQKFVLLTQHVLPRLRHRLAYGNPGKVTLCELDVTTRLYCRRWLHLPECFSPYQTGDGGGGLPCFKKEVPMNRVKSLYRMPRMVGFCQ